MSSKKNRARATDSAEAQTEETTPPTTALEAAVDPAAAPEIPAIEPQIITIHLTSMEPAAVLAERIGAAALAPTFETAAIRAQESDAEALSALCAAQAAHPSDLAERAIRALVERVSRRVLGL